MFDPHQTLISPDLYLEEKKNSLRINNESFHFKREETTKEKDNNPPEFINEIIKQNYVKFDLSQQRRSSVIDYKKSQEILESNSKAIIKKSILLPKGSYEENGPRKYQFMQIRTRENVKGLLE